MNSNHIRWQSVRLPRWAVKSRSLLWRRTLTNDSWNASDLFLFQNGRRRRGWMEYSSVSSVLLRIIAPRIVEWLSYDGRVSNFKCVSLSCSASKIVQMLRSELLTLFSCMLLWKPLCLGSLSYVLGYHTQNIIGLSFFRPKTKRTKLN